MINQKIVIMTSIAGLSREDRLLIAANNVQICQSLGLTGRVYVQRSQGLSIVEGTPDMTGKYIEALKSDPRVKGFIEHTSRMIVVPEYENYCVGLDVATETDQIPGVYPMSDEFLVASMPASPSARITMMMKAYIDPIAAV